MDPTGEDAPGTGIMGDETVVRDLDDGKPPGIYPDPPAHTAGVAVWTTANESPGSGVRFGAVEWDAPQVVGINVETTCSR